MSKIAILILLALSLFGANCTECHKKEKYSHNIHYTLFKAINITRTAWGINDSNVTFQTLPKPKKSVNSPADLVDDFLRRKCLKCHVNSMVDIRNSGIKRDRGCLACHQKHQDKGKCQREKPSMKKCLACHNKNYIGGDHLGLFPKDFDKSYRAPLTKKGYFPPVFYGIDYHHLNEDIHHKKGLSCISCHDAKDIHYGKKVSCKSCHKNLDKDNHPKYHKNISCIACHSSWGNYSYELSVFRDDKGDYKKWKRLILQEDEYLTNFLKKALRQKQSIEPKMPDWVNGKVKKGIWYSGYRYRRWEDFILGNDKNGKVVLLRPLYQYRISFRDSSGKMVLDDVKSINGKKIEAWIPYYPHTITKRAKSCEMCHENELILHPYKGKNETLSLKVPKNIVDATLLTKKQLLRMQSKRYKKIRAKMLIQY